MVILACHLNHHKYLFPNMTTNIEKVEKLMRKFQKMAHHAQFVRKWNYNQNNKLEMSCPKHVSTKSKFTNMRLVFQRSQAMRKNF
jgi:hypothetical protein